LYKLKGYVEIDERICDKIMEEDYVSERFERTFWKREQRRRAESNLY